ncbi:MULTISPECIES: lambda exonuclease family protein [unclassified Saccharibacter]|uniref:lambda exonuclease family protein n=1 Tax=unclassified Saccharibacter TaxID=2648722 RepID=UPI001327B191|nr:MULTISPECIES: lambda exonuclease family protein [unclassified Saccharibacter]MXV35720.1 hypothetical protein [Saccharibacter sp. EH611]MXV58333.1 hypothetical protein [Saccharibacter sp. EH70]MXV65858.1 hypothetical protein [Saccharibacter sp. EH60]
MKVYNVEQGSDEWMALRAGLPTASEFSKIITPKTHAFSSSAKPYAVKLAVEIILGCPLDNDLRHNQDVQRGIALEETAAQAYEFETAETAQHVGFITDDEGQYGASPDRLIGENGLLEIKCPRPEKHAHYMLNGFGMDYFVQVQGQLLVTGRQWCDRYSYCPGLRPYTERVERDEDFIAALKGALAQFHEMKLDNLRKLQSKENDMQEMPA